MGQILLQNGTVITKCLAYYKMRWYKGLYTSITLVGRVARRERKYSYPKNLTNF